jgi:phage terminase small subunit
MALDDCGLVPKLDPVRERFAQEYHATGNASEAYRRANPKSAKWTPHTLHVKASKVLAEDEVCMRLEQLQADAAKRHGTTINSLTAELEEAREAAISTGQVSAAVSAIMGKAKLHGLIVEKVKAQFNVKRHADDYTDDELLAIGLGGSTSGAEGGCETDAAADVKPH